jgi:Alpha/beta hydrolase domain
MIVTMRSFLVLASLSTILSAAERPAPTVSGPIAATAAPGDPSHDYPFFAALQDLKSRGYMEQEFFIQGVANRYETPATENGKVTDGGHAYKTRIVVRRPASASQFNGTVVIEWNNVTAGHDLDIDWFQAGDYWIRAGYAYIGVSPQRIGVEALKVWSAKRYGSLDVTADGTITNDALSYDIFSDVARAVRKPGSVDVLGGLKPARVFATGHSQSAARLGIYVNAVHPLAPVFDAVVLHGGGQKVRTDLDVKVWKLLSETDVSNQAALRQPDTDRFRSWEVAGDSHVDTQFIASSRALGQRDGNPVAPGANPGGRGNLATSSSGVAPSCDRPPYSHVPFYQVMDAAFDHLVRWVKDGTPPPSAPPIETSSAGPPAVFSRDKAGNSLGGIRLAEHAVPTAVNTGQNTGAGFCRLYGSHQDFDAATIAGLYPTHQDYVAAVKRVTEQNLKAGYILKPDADATIAAAEHAPIPAK